MTSQTATLLVTRLSKFTGGAMPLQINLDDKPMGVVWNGESCTIDIPAGHHMIFVNLRQYLSPSLSFDIAPGEEVTFLCQFKGMWSREILLWKQ